MLRFDKIGLALALVLLALLFTQGCRDVNKTLRNDQGETTYAVKVYMKVEGAGEVFPDVESWYEDRVPEIEPSPELGEDWFCLTWTVTLQPNEEYHVGCTFENSQSLQQSYTEWVFDDSEVSLRDSTGAYITLEPHANQGLVLHVSNFSPSTAVTVHELQATVSTVRYDLDSLDWNNATLGSLTWYDLTSAPISLPPGDDTLIDVDESLLPPDQWVLLRYKSGIQPPYDRKKEVAQEYTNVLLFDEIPTLSEWGMIIFCVVLLGWMAWMIVRRQRTTVGPRR